MADFLVIYTRRGGEISLATRQDADFETVLAEARRTSRANDTPTDVYRFVAATDAEGTIGQARLTEIV